jgi:hypothetical protein
LFLHPTVFISAFFPCHSPRTGFFPVFPPGFLPDLPQCFIGITHNVVKQPVEGDLQSIFPGQAAAETLNKIHAYVTQPGSVPPW